jgi:small subunit ribosomal protein S21
VIIINCENKRIEWALKKYRQKVDKIGQINELRNRREYEKPSQKRRKVKNLAKYKEKYGRTKF